MLPHPKAHGCIFFNYIFKAQAAQLAVSDSHSVLQEQENNQGQAVHCKMSYLLPGTNKIHIVLVEAGGNWYLPFFHHQILQRPRKSTAGTSLFHPEASLNKPPVLLPIVWTGLRGGCCYIGASSKPRARRVNWHFIPFPPVYKPSHPVDSDGSAHQPPW